MTKIFLLFAVGLAGLVAQSKADSRLFACFVWDDLGIGEVFYSDGSDKKELSFKSKRRSEYYEMPMGNTFRLFTEKEVDGKVVYEVVGETVINSTSKRLLMIVVRNKQASGTNTDELPLKIAVLDDSISKFPGGSTKFINLTAQSLTAEINGTKAVVQSKGAKLIRPEIPDNGGFVPLLINFGEMELYQSRIFCQKGERRVIFMRPNPDKDPSRPVLVDFLPQIVGSSFSEN